MQLVANSACVSGTNFVEVSVAVVGGTAFINTDRLHRYRSIRSGFCNCADYGFYDDAQCLVGIQDICSASDPATADMCGACGTDGSSYDTSECQKSIHNLLTGPYLDQCGWYHETPDFTTCRVRLSTSYIYACVKSRRPIHVL